MSRLLGALVLDKYAVVHLVELERSVVTDLERFHVVSSDIDQIMFRECDRCSFYARAMGYGLQTSALLKIDCRSQQVA